MESIFFQTVDWNTIPVSKHNGETGVAWLKTLQYGDFRMRLIEYSKNYKADHWCAKGHIVFCLEGEMTSELSDGRSFKISKGMSYLVTDGMSEHRSHSATGVKLLILDGGFLRKDNPIQRNPWRM